MNILLINPSPSGTLKIIGDLFPLSFIRMEWLQLKACLLYDTRSKQAIRDIRHHIKKNRLGIGTLIGFLKDYIGG